MKDEIQIIGTLIKQPCPSETSICKGCVLLIGKHACANRAPCPNTKEENVNWAFKEKVKQATNAQP